MINIDTKTFTSAGVNRSEDTDDGDDDDDRRLLTEFKNYWQTDMYLQYIIHFGLGPFSEMAKNIYTYRLYKSKPNFVFYLDPKINNRSWGIIRLGSATRANTLSQERISWERLLGSY